MRNKKSKQGRATYVPAMKPQGASGIKRTPKHFADKDDTDDNIYDVEDILDKAKRFGHDIWLIKWQGYPSKRNTWEPLENLAGLEGEIAAFEVAYSQRVVQLPEDAAAAAHNKEKTKKNKRSKSTARTSTGGSSAGDGPSSSAAGPSRSSSDLNLREVRPMMLTNLSICTYSLIDLRTRLHCTQRVNRVVCQRWPRREYLRRRRRRRKCWKQALPGGKRSVGRFSLKKSMRRGIPLFSRAKSAPPSSSLLTTRRPCVIIWRTTTPTIS